jgi:primosomal protein N' (replication factor Y) (superfamily II helicase)
LTPAFLELVFNLPVFQSFTYRVPVPAGGKKATPHDSYVGRRASVNFGSRRLVGFVVSERETLGDGYPFEESSVKPVLRIVDDEPIYSGAEIALARWISSFYLCAEGEALSAMLPSGKREVDAGLPEFGEDNFPEGRVDLSDEQDTAIKGVLDESDKRPAYIYGVTGSGKTEVFLQAAEAMLARGRGIIYLVPEIALTHQVVDSVVARFGNLAACLHSGLSGSKRLSEWMRIKRGEARIVIGARSAVFAPVGKLGLIIIDEEHDGSYKSGTTPRYHARQVAMRRASCEGATVVMGSATPSLEAWHQIKMGAIRMYPLTRRLAGGSFPEIETVTLGADGNAISSRLASEIRATKDAGRQTILFLNRRGFTHFFRCNTCGYELKCRNCSVPLTWHRASGVMKCHYCGAQVPPPTQCPECASLDVGYAGFGTEFIEEEVKRTFPGFSIRRVDTDALAKKGELKAALDDFRDGKTDILLGTQMVAKGLNFPGVRLVGIALADTGLHMPDFRASERTFDLIVQVAGRAGRFFPDGRVIIQTWNPKAPAIAFAERCDVEGFFAYELAQRAELGFPPFTRLVRLVFRSKSESIAADGARGAAEILKGLIPADAETMGPAECPIAQISGNWRHQIILRGSSLQPLQKAARAFLTDYKTPQGLYVETDVDPVSLL